MSYRCEAKYLKIFKVNKLFTTRKHVFCPRQTLNLFSTSFLAYLLMNLFNCVNSQMVSIFEFVQCVLFADHDIKSVFRRKTLGRERWKSTEKFTLWEIKLLFIFLLLFIKTLSSRDLQLQRATIIVVHICWTFFKCGDFMWLIIIFNPDH